MRVGLIAAPFIPVPPKLYGGTELFVAQLAEGLVRNGIEAVVYSNGESEVKAENRYLYRKMEWPVHSDVQAQFKDANHTAWAVHDAAKTCDVIHLNNATGLTFSRFVDSPFVYTIHHPKVPALSEFYRFYPEVFYAMISDAQRQLESMPRMQTIHHGISMDTYIPVEEKRPYLAFIGRIAPIKGVHLAIEVAKRSGIPLKIAGEVQPIFQDYFDTEIRPHIDGSFIEYLGPADFAAKSELLGNAMAMLFPIQWDEPFGLVMIESMACGTPVIALEGGSVREVVKNGVSGWVCGCIDEMVEAVQTLHLQSHVVREYAQANFSVDTMVERYIGLYDTLLRRTLPIVKQTFDAEIPAAA
ncbi:MAG: glycosyltransferase family 4 protein [Acidobacteriaceae bacterium]